jgi:hypothetical protein
MSTLPDSQQNDRTKRRLPSIEKKISELKSGDMRVSLIGTVIDKQNNKIILDDGSGKINVDFGTEHEVKMNQFVRVFGRVLRVGEELEMDGEIVQDMEKLDKDLYKKINSLKLR